MTRDELCATYRGYIACLNARELDRLGTFVDEAVEYNGAGIGLAGYRAMLEEDFRAIPDLRFSIGLLMCDPPRIACRLDFDCTPAGLLFGLPVNGRRVTFTENVFYEFDAGRIRRVWSVIDKAAVAGQL
ncbi:ester cyclase [Ancylobacter mangrovi]|uniref:ester cyclase n=1 Tax=Ancylobacter mangrovi TaxID=2972472 RepID=UPI0021637E56|nr:ester cyclase [Ancylobacter mangrovi]MCS0503163.1 ester cyclase [Ancylobacter mangrovi]